MSKAGTCLRRLPCQLSISGEAVNINPVCNVQETCVCVRGISEIASVATSRGTVKGTRTRMVVTCRCSRVLHCCKNVP